MVSVVRIKNGDIDFAVEEAIDLLGGIRGEKMSDVQMAFKKPEVSPYLESSSWFGAKQV